jgi:hypothetical protein
MNMRMLNGGVQTHQLAGKGNTGIDSGERGVSSRTGE